MNGLGLEHDEDTAISMIPYMAHRRDSANVSMMMRSPSDLDHGSSLGVRPVASASATRRACVVENHRVGISSVSRITNQGQGHQLLLATC